MKKRVILGMIQMLFCNLAVVLGLVTCWGGGHILYHLLVVFVCLFLFLAVLGLRC